jgi:predicted RNase H-like HicB family nuclease
MKKHQFQVIVEYDDNDNVWVTYVPALNGASTYGETREEAIEQTREMILGYLEALEQEHLPMPERSTEIDVVDVEVVMT